MMVSWFPISSVCRESHGFDYIKVLEILDLFGDELMNNCLAINLAFWKGGQNRWIYVRRPLLVQRNRDRSRSLFDDNRLRLYHTRSD
jgi:hypothetical protein